MRILFAIVTFVVISIISVKPVFAAKKRVVSTKTTAVKTAVKTGATGYSTARLSRPSNSVIITFINLDKVKKIDYVLSYAARGIQQGAGGAIVSNGQQTDSRDLYFGTCSKGVCTPHTGISGAVLTVTTTLKTGGTSTKIYRIRI